MRDVILPDDVLVVAIKRDGHSIVPHGYTSLHLHDEVTLIGLASSLEEVTIKLGY
jgi:Trk K+ transport system NAD-binding subunit